MTSNLQVSKAWVLRFGWPSPSNSSQREVRALYGKRGVVSQISLHFWGIPFNAIRSLYGERGIVSHISLHFWGILFNAIRSLYGKRGVVSQISLHFGGFQAGQKISKMVCYLKIPPKWSELFSAGSICGEGVMWFDFLCPFFLKSLRLLGSGLRPEPRRWLEWRMSS